MNILNSIYKKRFSALLSFSFVFGILAQSFAYADDIPEKEQYALMFAGELRNFVEIADQLRAAKSDDKEKLDELYKTGSRVARIYFQELNTENHSKLDGFMGTTLKQNPDLKNYFSIIGNAFIDHAQKLIQKQKNKNKVIRIWSTVGGAVLGVGIGGGYIYLVSKAVDTKSVLIAATAIVGMTAVGYGAGLAATYMLPVNNAVTNATEFALRYPHGEDFIHEIEGGSSNDIALGMKELEDLDESR